ncbi:MAG: helix-turn-helix domain-containing protein [Ignavibacteria bacterium]|nr:helix-turn-helix domain-containing protein [Ignavibacteria bacterium]
MATQFGNRIKELRSQQRLLQRQVAALLEMDTPLFSKIERGERIAKKEFVEKMANVLKADIKELLSLWLADQIIEVSKDEEVALVALGIAEQHIQKSKDIK